jgi:hypothetical protein
VIFNTINEIKVLIEGRERGENTSDPSLTGGGSHIGFCGVGPDQVFEIGEKSEKIWPRKWLRRAFWALKRRI